MASSGPGDVFSKPVRLLDEYGNTVEAEGRATTFADHLEQIEWTVRAVPLIPDTETSIFLPQDVKEGPLTETELWKAIFSLASGNAARDEDFPIVCYKALADAPENSLRDFLGLLNLCFVHRIVPLDWFKAGVARSRKKTQKLATTIDRLLCW